MSLVPSPPKLIKEPPTGPPVKMKIRSDLTFDRQTYQGVEYWVIKEPLGQKYYQFPPPVFYLLKQLDGNQTIDQLQDKYHEKFAPKRITRQDLQQLLTRFHQDGLVTSDVPGQGVELMKRGEKNRRMELFQTFSNVLAIRYRGFDPERILNFLHPFFWWIFTKPAVIATMVAATVALMSVIMNWGAFSAKLPGFDAFFDPRQWYLFVSVLCVTKICHEFGHGLSCKRLGGECHEIGFMLLVLTPCLYCNVSDSWRLQNKWHRAAIGAAGMYVEIILATIATFAWWFVQPGLVQDICLRVMLISSVSTVLFNGNPLLRFDGYYIMSDVLEIPNLQQKSTKALTTLMGEHWLGLEMPDDPLMPTNRPWAFAMFTVAAFLYRWVIMFSILLFLIKWLEPYGLESIGIGIALFSMIGIVIMPLYKLYKYMSVPGRMHQVKKLRFTVVSLIGAAVIGAILLIPFPHYLWCGTIILPRDIQRINVVEVGILEECFVKTGDVVAKNQPIARLRNYELEQEIFATKGRLATKRAQLTSVQKSGASGATRGMSQMTTLAAEMKEQSMRLVELEKRQSSLEIKAPIAGTVLETPYQHAGDSVDEGQTLDQQPFLSGYHVGVTAMPGQRFCEVADMSQWQAVILLTEQQIKFVKLDQMTKIRLYSVPDQLIKTKIKAFGPTDRSINRDNYAVSMQQGPQASSGQQVQLPDLVSEMVAQYDHNSLQFYASAPLESSDAHLKIGLGGQARLFTGYRSLGARVWWWLNQNFRM